ncbi:molybdopterin-binding protein [uncultured Enterovirga sp.]|uniref:molybdopterin-binding protein n=1 Tax=uncultured Enterovirga sp. TaxID=2026352 RepID=UPI0035CB3A32
MTRSPASTALMPLVEAVAALTADVTPVAPQRVASALALGCVAAETVVAGEGPPPGATALRDGWAVSFARVSGAGPHSPVPLGTDLAWMDAGDPVPAGFDTLLPPDSVEDGSAVADAPEGEGIRVAGGDLGPDDVILRAGELLRPLHLLALATAGVTDIAVRQPRIRLVTAGRLPAGRDALGPALAAVLAGWGCRVSPATPADAGPQALADILGEGEADAVFVLGGTGFGRADHAVEALALAGHVAAAGIALRPGETAAFGQSRVPVLLLPGRPESALAALLTLGRPLVDALAGRAPHPPRQPEPITRKVVSTIGMAEIVFVRRTASGLEPLGGVELPLRRLIEADGAVLVPPEREGYPAGTPLAWVPL